MSRRRIALIVGHPDPAPERFCRALAAACLEGAAHAGHETRLVDIAALDYPLLRSRAQWQSGVLPACLQDAQDAIGWADHLVIVFPLWMGSMPGTLRGFFEQVLRPAFVGEGGGVFARRLAGRSARFVVTMDMPALAYRWYFGAHGLRSVKRGMLGLCGISPIRWTLVGRVSAIDARRRERWIEVVRELGHDAR
jgi:putative NADPH-quinone reductase